MELRQTAEILQSMFECLFIGPIYSNVDYQGLIFPMSSPFAIFRKNQKLWMAGAVFIAIVAFVISPMIEYFSGSRGGRRTRNGGINPVLASWNGGSIRLDELSREWQQVRMANAFLRKLAIEVREKGGMPNVPEFAPDLSLVGITSDSDSQERIIERKVLVAEANRMGIHFDDESVKIFLKRFVDGKMDGDQINKTLKVATDAQMNLFDFNRLMREELAKNEVLRLAGTGIRFEDRRESRTLSRPALTTPGKNWQDFLKFNRAAKIQAFPVFVNDFEPQVKNKPTEKEIQDIYNEGKGITRSRRTIATQPAFMRAKTAEFEYLALDVEKIITEQMPLVPEETLRTEYERRVKEKQFRVPIAQEATSTPTAPGLETPSEEAKPANEGSEPTKQGAQPALPTENPPVDAKPSVDSQDNPALPPALADPKENASFQSKTGTIKLVSFQEEKGAASTTAETPKSTEPKSTETVQSNETSPASAATPTSAATLPETSPQSEPNASIEVSPPKASELSPGLPLQKPDVADSTPMRTKTFEEVREQIAREQATALAYKVVEDRIGEMVGTMSIYQSEIRAYQDAMAQKIKNNKAPDPIDLEKLGKDLGFEYGSTGLVDQESIQGTPIGTSFVMLGQRNQPFSFAMLVNESSGYGELFTPVTSLGFQGGNKRYLSWKIKETQPMTPSVDGVRDQIVEVWKKQQAFKLAESKARELATKVGSSSLKDALTTPEEKTLVLEPANFTWFNPMFARRESNLQLSNVELLQPVDDSFMEAVFACRPNDTVVASDSNKTVYYVVQVVELTPDVNALFEKFASAPFEGVSTVSQLESDRALQPWFQNLQKQIGFRGE